MTSNRIPTEGRHCGAGSSTLAIDPYGDVYPCVQWRKSIGSLHQQDISGIWTKNQELESIRRENNDAAKRVKTLGNDSHAAGFCPGLAHSLTGQYRLRFTLLHSYDLIFGAAWVNVKMTMF